MRKRSLRENRTPFWSMVTSCAVLGLYVLALVATPALHGQIHDLLIEPCCEQSECDHPGGVNVTFGDGSTRLTSDSVFMESVGMQPVIVHGGGKAISDAMQNAGIEPRFVQGRRCTDCRPCL